MGVEGISSSQIDSMLALLRTTAAQASPPSASGGGASPIAPISSDPTTGVSPTGGSAKVSFADALKNSLNQVNQVQEQAGRLGDQFAAGNDNISLSDVMIATQKASISLQTTVQVRNKMVAAYTDIMNMQI